jgi:AcrR family transcriptional regulator
MPRPARTEDPTRDTRTRIQQVALDLFTEQGYEATSLREIAERLGVTKAALYYHFRTKDEIVQSLLADHGAQVDAILAWARQQPPTVQTRREFVRRYADLLFGGENYVRFMHFLERNQSSAQKLRAGAAMRQRMTDIQAILVTPGGPPAEQLRRSLAVIAMHSCWFTLRGAGITDEQRYEAALEVALSLVE